MYFKDMEMSKILPSASATELDQMHIWRSKYIDKCSKCEAQLRRLTGVDNSAKSHFKSMAESLLSDSKGTKAKTKADTTLANLLEELIPLIELRAELAHSHIVEDASLDQSLLAMKNANHCHPHFDKLTVVSGEQRKHAYNRLAWITGQLTTKQIS